MLPPMEFSLLGRLSVTRATGPSSSTRMSLYPAMCTLLIVVDRASAPPGGGTPIVTQGPLMTRAAAKIVSLRRPARRGAAARPGATHLAPGRFESRMMAYVPDDDSGKRRNVTMQTPPGRPTDGGWSARAAR